MVKRTKRVVFNCRSTQRDISENNVSYLHHTTRVDRDHGADSSERRVFLFIVSYIAKRGAPSEGKSQFSNNKPVRLVCMWINT